MLNEHKIKLVRLALSFIKQGFKSFNLVSADCPYRKGKECTFISSVCMYCKWDNCRL